MSDCDREARDDIGQFVGFGEWGGTSVDFGDVLVDRVDAPVPSGDAPDVSGNIFVHLEVMLTVGVCCSSRMLGSWGHHPIIRV